jgi:hypothetical protein
MKTIKHWLPPLRVKAMQDKKPFDANKLSKDVQAFLAKGGRVDCFDVCNGYKGSKSTLEGKLVIDEAKARHWTAKQEEELAHAANLVNYVVESVL